MNHSQFVTKLRRARRDRGENIGEAARRAGIHRNQLDRLETGATRPHQVAVGVALALIKAFRPDLKLSDFTGR